MEKLFLSTALCLVLGIGGVQAQTQIHYGIKAGLNIATADFNASYEGDFGSETGFYVGPFVDINVTDRFTVQSGLLLSRQGYNFDHPSLADDPKYRNTYLNLPVMLRYSVIDQLYLEAGPQIGFLISSKVTLGDLSEDSMDLFKGTDFGFNIGAGYHLPAGFAVELRYVSGLSNISEALDGGVESLKNRVFSFGLAYTIK